LFKKKLVSILISTLIALGAPVFFHNPVSAANPNGWTVSGSYWKYSNNGSFVKGWLSDNGKWYYMGEDGNMKLGWSLQSKKWYYLNNDGSRAQNAWILYSGKWYYMDSNGQMLVSTTTPDGYVIGADGAWTGKTDTTMAPENLTATSASSTAINLQWTKSEGDDYYYVYYSLDNKTFNPIVSSGSTKRKYQWSSNYSASLTGIAPETKVYFKITATRGGVESKYSAVVNATTATGIVIPPTGLDAENAASSSTINLTWDNVIGANYYNVYYRKSTSTDYTVVKSTTNSYTLSKLSADTTIYVKVTAVKGKTESIYSSVVSEATDTVSAPTDVKAQSTSSNSIIVTWTKVTGSNSYYVYYRVSGDDGYTAINCTTNSYTLTDLDTNTKVYFKVTSVKDDVESGYNAIVSATTGNVSVAAPTGVRAQVASSSSLEFYWNTVTGSDYYYAYYRISSDSEYTQVKRTTNYFVLNDLDPETKVYFRVTNVDDGIESNYSSTTYATTESD